MELCGYNLASWLRKKETMLNSVITQLKQIKIIFGLISGLKFLHGNQIIHRDLKPANIMFTSEYGLPIKIGDFGQSRTIPTHNTDNPTMTATGIGTRTYTAPEVNTGKYSYQSDLFSMGLIIWEIAALIGQDDRPSLFNRLVYSGDTYLVKKDHPIMGKLVEQLVINLTKKKVQERCQSFDDIDKLINKWKSVKFPGKILTCRNGEDLELCLSFVASNSTIILDEGVYQGRFRLRQHKVKIMGKGVEKTVIKSPYSFDIYGNSCTILDLSVSPVNASATPSGGIHIFSNGCTLTNVNVTGAFTGIQIFGAENKITHTQLTKITDWGIELDDRSMNCILSDATIEASGRGILVRGTNHSLQKITIANDSVHRSVEFPDVFLQDGSNHTLEHFTCTGRETAETGCNLQVGSSSTTIKNCICHDILISGKDINLENIESRNSIRLAPNAKNIKLRKCRTRKLEAESTDNMIECDFAGNFKWWDLMRLIAYKLMLILSYLGKFLLGIIFFLMVLSFLSDVVNRNSNGTGRDSIKRSLPVPKFDHQGKFSGWHLSRPESLPETHPDGTEWDAFCRYFGLKFTN